MANYFGTDGIRGQVGQSPITPDFVLKLGWAAGQVIKAFTPHRTKVLIGKDTRISGYMFESALEAGLVAAGVDIYLLGPIPTPGVAYLTKTLRADAGIVISASHNLYGDNGIKFFDPQGRKFSESTENLIEHWIEKPMQTMPSELIGKAKRVNDAITRYAEFCKHTIPSQLTLDNFKIVLDCANGATYQCAPQVFRELGANIIELAINPDGFNINQDCGATDLATLKKIVLAEEADLGIAFDGDGDRVIMVDHRGEIVDGDELLLIIAEQEFREQKLKGGIVGTVMSNLGLELALQEKNIPFKRTAVGDKHIIETLLEHNWQLGGESSGHIVHFGFTSTGDGIISALQILRAMAKTEKSLHQLKACMKKFPQKLINIKFNKIINLNTHNRINKLKTDLQKKLGPKGRILLRASGTEPVIRVMVEGEDEPLIHRIAEELAHLIQQETNI